MTIRVNFDTDERRWRAVYQRDLRADGAFYYAVKTTGIFCRPGCASRLPKRRNVRFFDTCEQAELAGYRPCRRCTPLTISPQQETAMLIARACRRMETSDTDISLHDLATAVGLSPWHFHRVFKRLIGVTPKQYAMTLSERIQHTPSV